MFYNIKKRNKGQRVQRNEEDLKVLWVGGNWTFGNLKEFYNYNQ